MKKEQYKIVSEKVSQLDGEKLCTVLRAGSMANFGFGDLVETESRKFDENKTMTTKMVVVPRLALHVDCCFRLSCGEEIILSRGDIYEPSTKLTQSEDFNYNDFDWTGPYGNNRFEEIADKYFSSDPIDFTVKKVSVSKLGDLKINFVNGFLLEVFPDISGQEECWRFFEINADDHLVVNGQGLEENAQES